MSRYIGIIVILPLVCCIAKCIVWYKSKSIQIEMLVGLFRFFTYLLLINKREKRIYFSYFVWWMNHPVFVCVHFILNELKKKDYNNIKLDELRYWNALHSTKSQSQAYFWLINRNLCFILSIVFILPFLLMTNSKDSFQTLYIDLCAYYAFAFIFELLFLTSETIIIWCSIENKIIQWKKTLVWFIVIYETKN